MTYYHLLIKLWRNSKDCTLAMAMKHVDALTSPSRYNARSALKRLCMFLTVPIPEQETKHSSQKRSFAPVSVPLYYIACAMQMPTTFIERARWVNVINNSTTLFYDNDKTGVRKEWFLNPIQRAALIWYYGKMKDILGRSIGSQEPLFACLPKKGSDRLSLMQPREINKALKPIPDHIKAEVETLASQLDERYGPPPAK